MDDSTQPDAGAPTDPLAGDPRELMRMLLPAARREYIKAWELLANPATTMERRRVARDRATAIADDHAIVAAALREREPDLRGEDLHNARHLASELERHVDALRRMSSVSPIGLQGSKDLRPESLGCGKRYRDPARAADAGPGTRGAPATPRGGSGPGGGRRGKDAGGDARRQRRPFEDRGPKVPRDKLGTTKHDSQVGNDLDEATRAKLEALRAQLED